MDVTSGNEKYPEEQEIKKFLKSLSGKVYYIDATGKAMRMGSPILRNMIMIGVLWGLDLLPLSINDFQVTLSKNFTDNSPQTNLQALAEGIEMVR